MAAAGDDAGDLPTERSRQLLAETLERQLGTAHYTQTIYVGSNKGDNYLGIVYRVVAESEHEPRKRTSVIVKLPPQSEARRNQFYARVSFLREILFYTSVVPMFDGFTRGRDVPAGDGFCEYAECFHTSDQEYEEALFMDDLKDRRYEMFDRHKDLSYGHVQLVLRALGKLHALSLAIKDQEPELLAPYKDIVDIFATREEDQTIRDWFDMLKTRTLEALAEVNGTADDDVYRRTVAALPESFTAELKSLSEGAAAEPYAVLCHGDCWNNNILFRHDESGQPIGMRFLDWQIMRYASPVLDLMYFVFSATTEAMRAEHYDDMLHEYHNSASNFLRQLGTDPEIVFPFDALEDQLQRFGRFGLLMAVMLLPVITTKSEDVPDLESIAEQMESGNLPVEEVDKFRSEETESVYKAKIAGVCRDMARFGYI